MDDPYRISRTREGTVVEDKLVKQAIRYAKVKTMDVVGVTSMTTGAILFHAYKDVVKDLLHEAAVKAEAEHSSVVIEKQDEIRSPEELEEEARLQERKQELDRKVRENQRIVAAQQARKNRLSGKNITKNNLELIKQETRIKVKNPKVSKQIEEKKKRKDTKWDAFCKKYKLHIGVLIVAYVIFPPIRGIMLLLILIMVIKYFWPDIKEALKRLK